MDPLKVVQLMQDSNLRSYVQLKELSDRSGVRLLHLYRLSHGQQVKNIDTRRLAQAIYTLTHDIL